MPEMAAEPLPPSAMAQPGILNLNNEVSARAETVGCGAPSEPPASPAARAAGGVWGPGKAERGRPGPFAAGRREPRAGLRDGSLSGPSLLITLCKRKLRIMPFF